MKTSYFSKSAKNPNAVSISLGVPHWFDGRQYKKLAPPAWLLKRYKQDGDKARYIDDYYNSILINLDAKQVYEELGEDAVLLCWESSEKFCHRHIVSSWLKHKLDIDVEEM